MALGLRTRSTIRTALGALAVGLVALSACSGSDGSNGKAGAEGAEGEQGEQGAEGEQGSKGEQGEPGAEGAEGEQGEPGEPGEQGERGEQGEQGDKGDPGEDATLIPGATYAPLLWEPVAAPISDAEKREILASSWASRYGETSEIGYHVLARSGDDVDGTKFGLMLDEDGDAIVNDDDSEFISNYMDFTSLLKTGDKMFSITHFESRPGAMYLSELEQDEATGELTIVSTQNVDMSAVGGLWVPCAGSVTPWGTHLGSEEYPPDARAFGAADFAAASGISPYMEGDIRNMGRYFKVDPEGTELSDYQAAMSAYYWGYPVEISVDEDGGYSVDKHYSMGRRALELAYVMPDQKTVYISDDGTNMGFYMYVADSAGDLSSGTLFAAKWIQTSGVGAGAADIEWVKLGSATDAEIKVMVFDDNIQFSDIFTVVDEESEGVCPAGSSPSIYNSVFECLQLNSGMEKAAAFLESGRYAAMLGATVEFRKEEGITFDPYSSTMYVAISDVDEAMLDADSYDLGGPNHMRVERNDCGAVYALDVAPNSLTGSDYTAMTFRSFIEGVPVDYTDDSPYAGNSCSVNGISSPDNVTFIPEHSTLIIGEDTEGHQNDMIWAYDVVARKLTRIQTTPYGSETTSPYWYPNINGFSYLASVVQHPYGESDEDQSSGPDDNRAYAGYVGPFPVAE